MVIARASILLLYVSCAAAGCGQLPDSRRSAGDDLVARVEQYRAVRGALPEDVRALGVEERLEGPAYYRRVDSTRYEVWYGADLGESVTYRSETGDWE